MLCMKFSFRHGFSLILSTSNSLAIMAESFQICKSQELELRTQWKSQTPAAGSRPGSLQGQSDDQSRSSIYRHPGASLNIPLKPAKTCIRPGSQNHRGIRELSGWSTETCACSVTPDSLQLHDHKARLPSFVISWSLLKLKSIESGMHSQLIGTVVWGQISTTQVKKGLISLAGSSKSDHNTINSEAKNVQTTLSPTDTWNLTIADRTAAWWRKAVGSVCVCVCACVCVLGVALWNDNTEAGIKTQKIQGTSLVVQRLRLWAPKAEGPSSNPGQGTRLHTPQLRVHMPQRRSQIPQAAAKTWWVKETHFFF